MALERVETDRLVLERVQPADLDDLYDVHADPRLWTHLPGGRHTSREQTAEVVAAYTSRWDGHELGYWTARARVGIGGLAPGAFVGVGGCSVVRGTAWWNLYYRLRAEAHGHGLAAELARAALDAAHTVAPELPVVAFLLEHNVASRRTAERAGLRLIWRGRDAGNPDPGAVRLVFADRPLTCPVLLAIVRRP